VYWSYPFSTYSVAKRTLSFSSQDEDDYWQFSSKIL
jgi:hypothetical protein